MSDELPATGPVATTGTTELDVAAIRQQLAGGTVFRFNREQEYIGVYAYALKDRLRDFEAAVVRRTAWQGPAGLALGLLSALITILGTRDFPALFGLSRDMWIAGIFVLMVLAAACAVVRATAHIRRRKGETVEDVIRDVKPRPVEQDTAAPP